MLPLSYVPPSYELRDFTIKDLAVVVYRSIDQGSVMAVARMKAPGAEDGYTCTVTRSESLGEAFVVADPACLTRAIKRVLLSLLEHEIEEKLYRDGERVFTPHPERITEVPK
jgi:hypothetical protein